MLWNRNGSASPAVINPSESQNIAGPDVRVVSYRSFIDLAVNGVIEKLVFGCVAGWARDTDSDGRITLVVSVNGVDVTETVANLHHDGLAKKGIGDGNYGFFARLPPGVFRESGENIIRVRTKSHATELKGSPLTTDSTRATGRLGGVKDGYVRGWVAPELPLFRPIDVKLIVDGITCGHATPTLLRDDMRDYGLSDHPSGLRLKLPRDVMDGNEHVIEIFVHGHPLRGSPKIFKAIRTDENAAHSHPTAATEAITRRPDAATATLAGIQTKTPSARAAFVTEMERLETAGDTVGLIAHLSAARTRFPKNLAWRIRYITLRRERGAELWALNAHTDLAAEFPDHRSPAMQAGFTARALGLHETALAWFRKAVSLDAGAPPRIQCAMELIHLGRADEAREILDSIDSDADDSDNVTWLKVVLLARTDRAAAGDIFQQLLLKEQDCSRLVKLIQQGRKHFFNREIELTLQQHVLHSTPELHILRVRNLFDLGERRKAREVLSALTVQDLTTLEQLQCAELWLAAGCTSRARSSLHDAVETLRQTPLPPSKCINFALKQCHQFGESHLRDELFQHACRNLPAQSRPNALEQVTRLNQEGRLSEATTLLEIEAQSNPDLPLYRWKAKLALENLNYHDAISQLETRVQGPVVPLEDTRLWIKCLINAEELDWAEQELNRLQPHYAEADLASLRAEILNLNMQFEHAIEYLQAVFSKHPLNMELALSLAGLMLDSGDITRAGELIDYGLSLQPANTKWATLKLSWSMAAAKDWDIWHHAYQGLWRRLNSNDRVNFLLLKVGTLLLMRKHTRAERLLGRFMNAFAAFPLSHDKRARYTLRCARLWSHLDQQNDSYSLLSQLDAAGVAPTLRDLFYRASSSIESYGQRNPDRFVALRNQLSHLRHHVNPTAILPPAVSSDVPEPCPRVAVLIHLFYTELWPELRTYLDSLRGTTFNCFVTTHGPLLDEKLLDELKSLDPTVRILEAENRGFDVGAHWQSLDRINLDDFDAVLFLQTKKSSHFRLGPVWRNNLVKSLIGTPTVWRANLKHIQEHPDVGIIGSLLHYRSADPWHYRELREVLDALGAPTRFDEVRNHSQFVAGTMFLIRASLLKEIHDKTRGKITFERYEDLSIAKRNDKTLAHAMERAFGIYTNWRGYRILWRA